MVAVSVHPVDVTLLEMAERVKAVHLAAYSQEAALAGVASLPPMERSTAEIQGLSESFFGAFISGVLVGVISESEGDDSIEVCSLAVLPAFQLQGVGGTLLRHLVVRADGKAMVVTTAAANAPAISLYQGAGFVVLRHSTAPKLNLQLVHLQRPGSNPSVKGTSRKRAARYVER